MNVRELIEKLEAVDDKDLEVCTEGCDCDGDVAEVEARDDMNDVYLERSDGAAARTRESKT